MLKVFAFFLILRDLVNGCREEGGGGGVGIGRIIIIALVGSLLYTP